MSKPLDEEYLEWLYGQVASTRLRNPAKTHWALLCRLYKTEFDYFVPNDDNRAEDGRELRYEFLDDIDEDAPLTWLDEPCSFLEMMIGLSRRLAFEAGGQARGWFWHLMDNLNLRKYTDDLYDQRDDFMTGRINRVLERINRRDYEQDGSGGLFPLDNPREDQRDVEIWYQMNTYLLERA